MPKISFVKSRQPIEVPEGANLMKALLEADIPVASSCHGDGVCVKCCLQIIGGRQNLSAESELEQDLREIHEIPRNERISCQTDVLGDITIDATYW